jgi:hypothetical protein
VGMRFIHPANYHPFAPEGWPGVLTGGSIIFFTYIGFDSVSTAAEEARNPQRDLPIGIIATLIVCTVLYIAVAVVLTGIVPWRTLIDDAAPVVNSMSKLAGTTKSALLHWTELAVLFGAMMGMISSLLVFQLGQARVWFSMSRDGLLPKLFSRVHPRFRTPATATWIAGFLVGIPGGILDIGTLSDLSNIGTLFAFVLVSIGVVILRSTQPRRRRGFTTPGGIAAPILSVLFCVVLMSGLPILTWLRFFVWLIIGLTVYMLYSRHRSEFSVIPTVPSKSSQDIPVPPDLHWGVLLVLNALTGGIFGGMVLLVQAIWLRVVEPASKALFYVIAATGGFALALVLLTQPNTHGIRIVLVWASEILLMIGVFSMRSSIEEHFKSTEQLHLRLSGVMTFFFHVIYFQYHFTKIAQIKRDRQIATAG